MRRRLLAATAALVLLVAGTLALLAYVRGADARALAGTRTVEVLVADELIPQGTPATALADLVSIQSLPAKAALAGRVTDLSALGDRVSTVDLQPGEQLLESRFERLDDLQAPGTVAVPAGLQEVSILLEPQRAIGGRLAAGDTVGVVVSMSTPATHSVLHRVLVTQVQGAPAPASADGGTETASAGSAAPSASLMITLAVTAAQAEAVVFGIEHGTLWLTLEAADADLSGTEVITQDNIHGKAFS
ncbi:Flp pilus assembly protein CpaB [Geodermatophilus ruber]|uniref:Pilus assembly protein CpaB n=1 Tax=Geodermatophilus ruber TaxID=504800 RepID=A0A1I4CEW8_9ACTN|nr:RcpC/CpaB family pilus assembly protein [Geodermatophilus ruber]SFK79734.1 pilus assembly protein CpaB [Geodermatophilus ruber]